MENGRGGRKKAVRTLAVTWSASVREKDGQGAGALGRRPGGCMVECKRKDAMRSAGSPSPRSGIPGPAGRSWSGIKRPGSAALTMRPKVAKPPRNEIG